MRSLPFAPSLFQVRRSATLQPFADAMPVSVSPRFTTYFCATRIGAGGGVLADGAAAGWLDGEGCPASVSLGGTDCVLAQPAMTSTAAKPGSHAALR